MAKIDDSVKKKVPELRFKGFTDDWEERKLDDIAPFFSNYPNNLLVGCKCALKSFHDFC
uniref:HsdS restriction endonuclease subunit S n=1 Tax=Enterococcus faecium TaxID=1352 RepID=A0A7G9XVC0_ENTFC|nr:MULTISPECIES: hypothetical protein [Enterococcus]QNO39424.1 HsdS restriction endonuclease subunit S [Enterococcus faecium]